MGQATLRLIKYPSMIVFSAFGTTTVALLDRPNIYAYQGAEAYVVSPPESMKEAAIACHPIDSFKNRLRCRNAFIDALLRELPDFLPIPGDIFQQERAMRKHNCVAVSESESYCLSPKTRY